jgi:hypothetical protein
MNFTLIKELDKNLETKIINFFLKSKPYDFCCLPSRNLSVIKIREYIRHLFEHSVIYISKNFFIALSVENETATIEFLFGSPFEVIGEFKKFRSFFHQINPQVKNYFSEIQRKHKRQHLIKMIQRRDETAKIKLDNHKICVLWNT